jgi:hypothetical protein
MNSPWQLGLLAIAVTGISTYDYMFFKNRKVQKTPVTEIHVSQPISSSAEPLLARFPGPVESEKAMDVGGDDLRPAISLDELRNLSKQAFIIKEDLESDNVPSPLRQAPVNAKRIAGKPVGSILSIAKNNNMPAAKPVPEPQCVFSGTLIEGRKKLALVNGMPMMVGDRLGMWQLAQIESDYIVLESGSKTHRIEMKSLELQSAPRKDPS